MTNSRRISPGPV